MLRPKIKKYLLIVAPFIIYILYLIKQWYLPQIYHAGVGHIELITVIIEAFLAYALVVLIIQKTPIPIIAILVWNYLLLVLSSHGLLINEVHLFKSSALNNIFLYGLCTATSLVLIAAMMLPSIKDIPTVQASIRLIFLLPLMFAVIQGLRRIFGFGQELSLIVKASLFVLALVSCYLIGRVNFIQYWISIKQSKIFERSVCAVIAGSIIFFTSGFIQTPIFDRSAKYTVFDFKKINSFTAKKQSVLFLVLDELSPEYVDQLLIPIAESGVPYRFETIVAPTAMTADAIPSLLSGELYQDMEVCGFSTICSSSQKFDFSELKANGNEIDVIGMHHAYCSIKNLRSCYTYSAFHRVAAEDFYCRFQHLLARLIPEQLKKILLPCFTEVGYREQKLNEALEIANKTPFWSMGGALYMHLPIPHPAIEGSDEDRVKLSLHDHYKTNVVEATKIVNQLLKQLISRFNDNFTFVITSDHSLRLSMWCGQHFECNPEPNVHIGVVPFIVISPSLRADAVLPRSQIDIFN